MIKDFYRSISQEILLIRLYKIKMQKKRINLGLRIKSISNNLWKH